MISQEWRWLCACLHQWTGGNVPWSLDHAPLEGHLHAFSLQLDSSSLPGEERALMQKNHQKPAPTIRIGWLCSPNPVELGLKTTLLDWVNIISSQIETRKAENTHGILYGIGRKPDSALFIFWGFLYIPRICFRVFGGGAAPCQPVVVTPPCRIRLYDSLMTRAESSFILLLILRCQASSFFALPLSFFTWFLSWRHLSLDCFPRRLFLELPASEEGTTEVVPCLSLPGKLALWDSPVMHKQEYSYLRSTVRSTLIIGLGICRWPFLSV